MPLLEGYAVELMGSEENPVLEYPVQLEVGLELGVIKGIAGLADHFGIVIPVP